MSGLWLSEQQSNVVIPNEPPLSNFIQAQYNNLNGLNVIDILPLNVTNARYMVNVVDNVNNLEASFEVIIHKNESTHTVVKTGISQTQYVLATPSVITNTSTELWLTTSSDADVSILRYYLLEI